MTIKQAREFAGYTQQDVEEEFGVPIRSLQNWEAGIRQPPEYVEKYLVQALCQTKQVARIKAINGPDKQEVTVETLQGDEWELAHSAASNDGLIPLSLLTTIGRLSEAGYKLIFM